MCKIMVKSSLVQCDIEAGYILLYSLSNRYEQKPHHKTSIYANNMPLPIDRSIPSGQNKNIFPKSPVKVKSRGYRACFKMDPTVFVCIPLPKDSLIRKVSIYNESLLGQEEELFK